MTQPPNNPAGEVGGFSGIDETAFPPIEQLPANATPTDLLTLVGASYSDSSQEFTDWAHSLSQQIEYGNSVGEPTTNLQNAQTTFTNLGSSMSSLGSALTNQNAPVASAAAGNIRTQLTTLSAVFTAQNLPLASTAATTAATRAADLEAALNAGLSTNAQVLQFIQADLAFREALVDIADAVTVSATQLPAPLTRDAAPATYYYLGTTEARIAQYTPVNPLVPWQQLFDLQPYGYPAGAGLWGRTGTWNVSTTALVYTEQYATLEDAIWGINGTNRVIVSSNVTPSQQSRPQYIITMDAAPIITPLTPFSRQFIFSHTFTRKVKTGGTGGTE